MVKASTGAQTSPVNLSGLVETLRRERVGGCYWGTQPTLPPHPYTLVRLKDARRLADRVNARADRNVLAWLTEGSPSFEVSAVRGTCDPWHLLSGAANVVVDSDDELALIAALHGLPLDCVGEGRFSALSTGGRGALERTVQDSLLTPFDYSDPFTGEPLTVLQAAHLCGFWRRLIDSNRTLAGAVGFAAWKKETVAPLLWDGTEVRFRTTLPEPTPGQQVAVWRSRCSPSVVSALDSRGDVAEVEDGFIRSTGLGADCVPPLSIVVDRRGIYFDPSRPSDLEWMLEHGELSDEVLARSRDLRAAIVASGVSKYGKDGGAAPRRSADRRHILVTGQVEDDRSILTGGSLFQSNLELLRRVRESAPDAYILYKPHPDVEAGHRVGAIADQICLAVADEIVRAEGISPLIAMVDEVHVNTSLAGFEALLRGKPVTTYGMPFYAGWGLTDDRAPVPARRSRRRSLDELVAAVLLLYPRYLDPLTGLPCPPEILIRRLSSSTSMRRPSGGALVRLRRIQGQIRRLLAGGRGR